MRAWLAARSFPVARMAGRARLPGRGPPVPPMAGVDEMRKHVKHLVPMFAIRGKNFCATCITSPKGHWVLMDAKECSNFKNHSKHKNRAG